MQTKAQSRKLEAKEFATQNLAKPVLRTEDTSREFVEEETSER